jgi:hypothetical protein
MGMREGRSMLRAIRLPLALAWLLACVFGAAGARAAESRDLGDLEPAESREAGEATEPGSAESAGRWQPPACDELEVDVAAVPPAEDRSGWSTLLENAHSRVGAAQSRLAAADSDYTHARNRQWPRGGAHGTITAERDAARLEYARARCALPALVEAARRAGVAPDVWRDYPASLP